MKKMLALVMLAMLVMPVQAHDQECRVDLEYRGIYYVDCPRGYVVTGVDSRHPDPRFPPRVECSEIVLVCEDVDKEED